MSRLLLVIIWLVVISLPINLKWITPSVWATDFAKINQNLHNKYPDIKMIGVEEVYKTLGDSTVNKNPPILLDARKRAEYSVSHIQGAIHTSDIESALMALANNDKSARIIVYCSLGYRSGNLVRKLNERGFSNVVNMKGSLFEWVEKDYPVYQDSKQVNKVHPFNPYYARYLRKDYHSYSP